MIIEREILKQINQLTRNSPFYAKFNQHKYRNPKGYIEKETVTFQLARQLVSYQADDASFFNQYFIHKQSLIVLNQAYHCGFKSFWLSEKLLEAFCHSQVPQTLLEFKRVIPVGLLLLPPKLKNPHGQLVKWVMFYHRLASEPILPIISPKAKIQILAEPVDTLTWFTLLDDGTQYGANRPLKIESNRFNYQVDGFHLNEMQERGKNIETATEKEFSGQITDLLIQTLLYLQLNERELEPVKTSERGH